MTFILDSLQMVVLILGAAAVLAFLLHNMRSRPRAYDARVAE